MANKEDRTLPNWRKTEEECAKEGWKMVGGDPTHWENEKTGEVIKGRDYKEKKGGK